ncbi:MAG: DegT/DnrJ/EryC1/StrS aminotransferase family protein [Proteobacteria bacterium]|nr:DegT/DnrJ/EryC1/StrS aminotransferase family protein [Pseudomonadota bacterium]
MAEQTSNIKELVRQIYFPPISKDTNWSFSNFIGHDNIRYYSYARHALYDALKLCELKKGDKVLIPNFICREVLSSINKVGAVAVYYDVTPALQVKSLNNLPAAKAIVIVNYFGFPANLDSIREYCLYHAPIVIEDNSHGFLSKDNDNKPLGTRTDIGIFSLRKSMPVINGAALVINDSVLKSRLNKQLNYVSDTTEFKYECFKKKIKMLVPSKRYSLIIKLVKIKQRIRRLLKGTPVIISSLESEYNLPYKPNPHIDLKKYIKTILVDEEIERRRSLYKYLTDYLGQEVELIVTKLDGNVVPYVFPFHCNEIDKIKIKLKKINLSCYKWPELPEQIQSSCPDYYKNVWMVPFLW